MEIGQLMIDILLEVSCKFEMYIFKIAQVINENVHIAFLYVLSIHILRYNKYLEDRNRTILKPEIQLATQTCTLHLPR